MKKKYRVLKWVVSISFVLALLIGFFWPVNSYIETPGGAADLKPFVKIDDHPDKQKGEYMITYVQLEGATPFKLLLAHFNPHASIEKAQAITGGVDDATYNRVQNFYMQNAISEAVAVAFKAAHSTVESKYIGIFITDIAPQSHFKSLKVGDTVTKVDGHHFDNAKGYQTFLADKPAGTKVTVTYIRQGKVKTTTAPLMNLGGGRSGLGIILADNVEVSTKPKVKVDPGQIGGPSGGLMFSLQIYDQLTGSDLRNGRKIAGTGTISLDGSVGEIGGIDKKIIAANAEGAKIFFAPYVEPTKFNKLIDGGQTNYQVAVATAKKYAPDMKVVPVTNFMQAVEYLKMHR